MKYLFIILLVLFLIGLAAPRRVPKTLRRAGKSVRDAGRLAEELATGKELDSSPLARYEVRAGKIVEMKVLADNPYSNDASLQAEVQAIGARLSTHALRKQIPYRFAVIESDAPNAFAVPGGAIFITRQLIDLCGRDADSIACVLGHEIIHIDRRHALHNLAASTVARTGLQVLTLGRGAILARVAGGMQQLLVQGYRQDQELEADRFGVRIAKLAGFNPHGLIALLERLRELKPDGSGPLAELFQYFKSHPPTAVRIEKIKKEIAAS